MTDPRVLLDEARARLDAVERILADALRAAEAQAGETLVVDYDGAAALLGISNAKVREMVRQGLIPVCNVGAQRRIRRQAIVDYLLENEERRGVQAQPSGGIGSNPRSRLRGIS